MRTFTKRIILLLTVCTGICGCGAASHFEQPQMPVSEHLYGFEATDTTTIADISWKDFFTDPFLQKIIGDALENNADINVAREKINEAQAELDKARKAFLPSLGIKPSGSLYYSEPRYGGAAHAYSLPFSAGWEIDLSGKLALGKKIAAAERKDAEIYLQSVQTELIATIAECYYTLLKLDAQLEISLTTSKNWKENVRIMKAMKDAGLANEASVSRTEANCLSIEASLFDLEYQIKTLQNRMSVLTGTEPREFERGSIYDETLSSRLSCGIPLQLLSRRPDVMRAQIALEKAFYNKKTAEASFYPSLTISGEIGWDKAVTSPAGLLASLGAGLVQPIFSKGVLKGNLEITKAREREASVNFRNALLNAGAEVNSALALCESAREKADIRIKQIEALESAVSSTEQLMRLSESTYLEVLTAQQDLLSAQLQQISDHYDAVSGAVELYRALGGGRE